MYICGLIPQNFAELDEVVPIGSEESCETTHIPCSGAYFAD